MAREVKLVMTPQLQQAIKILQLSLPEVEAVVQKELDANPMLEPLDQSVAKTSHSVNVDLETLNTPDGEPDCREHRGAGPHYDITIHPAGCPHHGRPRASQKRRYWRNFATMAEAENFANDMAARPDASLLHPVRVRFCQVSRV
jgi:DNA-directed RNA polymerase specialized sigma54-like protein